MLKIGVTGGIGSGKSTVCHLFAQFGATVYDSDNRAKALMNSDTALRSAICTLFGTEAYNEQGLDRAYVAQQVFGHADRLSALNAVVHPAVACDFQAWAEQQSSPYVIQEAAVLFESGADRHLDKVVNVEAPESLRVTRTCRRDGIPAAEVERRMRHQLSDAERRARADYTITTDESQLLIPQVLALHELFCTL